MTLRGLGQASVDAVTVVVCTVCMLTLFETLSLLLNMANEECESFC